MSVSQSELANRFSDQNPEAGNFGEGTVDFEQVKSLTDILSGKIKQLSREKIVTDREVSFIQRASDLSARSIQYMIEQMDMTIPNNSISRAHLGALITATGQIEGSWDDLPTSGQIVESPAELVELLSTIPAATISLRHMPYLRAPLEDYAVASLDLITDIADHFGGLKVDHSLEGNIQNMIAHYELIVNE